MNPGNPQESRLSPLSLYPLVPSETESGVYGFETRYGIAYRITFIPDAEYIPDYPFAHSAFSFVFTDVKGELGRRDPRIKATIAYALGNAFAANPELIISYTCSTLDGQERPRRLLFGQWYLEHEADHERLNHTDRRSYSATIFRRNHPQAEEIRQCFSELYSTNK